MHKHDRRVVTLQFWYQKNILCHLLRPLSWLYRLIIAIRYFLYQKNIFKINRVNAPVIVVGNITVGGTGKTPLVIALVNFLKKEGYRPGVILRGYRGKNTTWPVFVDHNSNPVLVGDEAVLIASNTHAPVVAGPNRFLDATKLIDEYQCNVIISDDGLQHYSLHRDIEIAVIDMSRQFGNGFCLPAGPLREPISRLQCVDFIVENAEKNAVPGAPYAPCSENKAHKARLARHSFLMQFKLDEVVSLHDSAKKITPVELSGKKIMAVAGIGNPDRFFATLSSQGFVFEKKIFPDHHFFSKKDFEGFDVDIIIITEKDAVKCASFCDTRFYVAKGCAMVDPEFFMSVARLLQSRK